VDCRPGSCGAGERGRGDALDIAGEANFLNQPFTAESLTNVLNVARERLITGMLEVPR
jgi:hypothetical protein